MILGCFSWKKTVLSSIVAALKAPTALGNRVLSGAASGDGHGVGRGFTYPRQPAQNRRSDTEFG